MARKIALDFSLAFAAASAWSSSRCETLSKAATKSMKMMMARSL